MSENAAKTRLMRRFLHETQMLLVRNAVSLSTLKRSGRILQPRHYEDIVYERSCLYRCGYPECGKSLPRKKGDISSHCFVVIKPHIAENRNLAVKLIKVLQSYGFQTSISKTRRLQLSKGVADSLAYNETDGKATKELTSSISRHLSSGTSMALLLKYVGSSKGRNGKEKKAVHDKSLDDEDIIKRLHKLAGPLDPSKGQGIRAKFGKDHIQNVIYISKDIATRDADARQFFSSLVREDRRSKAVDRSKDSSEPLRPAPKLLKYTGDVWLDISGNDRFCNVDCATKSELFKRMLSDDPPHLRPIVAKILEHIQKRKNSSVQSVQSKFQGKEKPKSQQKSKPNPTKSVSLSSNSRIKFKETKPLTSKPFVNRKKCSAAVENKAINTKEKFSSSIIVSIDQHEQKHRCQDKFPIKIVTSQPPAKRTKPSRFLIERKAKHEKGSEKTKRVTFENIDEKVIDVKEEKQRVNAFEQKVAIRELRPPKSFDDELTSKEEIKGLDSRLKQLENVDGESVEGDARELLLEVEGNDGMRKNVVKLKKRLQVLKKDETSSSSDEEDVSIHKEVDSVSKQDLRKALENFSGRWMIYFSSLQTELTKNYLLNKSCESKEIKRAPVEETIQEAQVRVYRMRALLDSLGAPVLEILKQLRVRGSAHHETLMHLRKIVETFRSLQLPPLEKEHWEILGFLVLKMINYRQPAIGKALEATNRLSSFLQEFTRSLNVNSLIESFVLGGSS